MNSRQWIVLTLLLAGISVAVIPALAPQHDALVSPVETTGSVRTTFPDSPIDGRALPDNPDNGRAVPNGERPAAPAIAAATPRHGTKSPALDHGHLSLQETLDALTWPLSAEGWQQLRDRADEGDAQAAYELAIRLTTCASIEHQLDQVEADLRLERSDPLRLDHDLGAIESEMRKCAGVDVVVEEIWTSLRRAAQLGHADAIRDRYFMPMMGPNASEMSASVALGQARTILAYKQETDAMMMRLALRGHGAALGDLAISYWQGNRGAPDLPRAVAFFRVAARATVGHGIMTPASYLRFGQYNEAKLNAPERAEADRIERELERAIAGCCG